MLTALQLFRVIQKNGAQKWLLENEDGHIWAICRSSSTTRLKRSPMRCISTHAQIFRQHLWSFLQAWGKLLGALSRAANLQRPKSQADSWPKGKCLKRGVSVSLCLRVVSNLDSQLRLLCWLPEPGLQSKSSWKREAKWLCQRSTRVWRDWKNGKEETGESERNYESASVCRLRGRRLTWKHHVSVLI